MSSKEDAKKEVNKLIEKYKAKIQSGIKYNEEMTKKDFILPLFRALGWDIEESDEVTAEESLLKGAVDYAFLIDKNYKFFVEAKPLGSDLKRFAQQAVEYGVNSGNTWVVLTSFESLVIFNCEWKEKNWWKNSLFSLEVKDYLDSSGFDKLWLLSKESTINNALDDYAKSISKGVPRTPIDKELLSKFLQYRTKLSKEISKDSKYSEEEIDEIVQRLLVRLLFIRNCEDRGFETKYKLLSIIKGFKTHKKGLSRYMKLVFEHYDKNYDSSIFEEMEIDKVKFDEELFAEIIEGLYYTSDELRYDFNIIPSDVMGRLYEQYLGHILKKTPQTAKLKEGKAHRKEQGIYYTPTYVVDYIVRNTLGEVLNGKKVDASKIRVLDPACGSGSFLVKAFDVLNEHYAKDKMYGQKTLTGYSTKERILKNNIFGVDLDKQAVEIAQLNLLLRIAEKEQKLPLLKQNIKVGNSLIDDPAVAGDKAFKWEEQFKDIIQEEGFDVVIGNPPWLMAGYHTTPKEIDYLHEKYESAKGKFDLYYCFIEKALKLISNKGIFGMIVPNKFFHTKSAKGLREVLMKSGKLYKIVDFGDEKVFGDATNYSSILLLKHGNHKKITYTDVDAKLNIKKEIQINVQSLTVEGWYFEDKIEKSLFDKMNTIGTPLIQITKRFGTGAQTGADKLLLVTEENINKFGAESKIFCKILRGRDVRRYSISKITKLAIFPYKVVNNKFEIFEEDEIKKYKRVWQILESNKNNLSKRIWFGKNATQLSGKYYGFMYLDDYSNFKTLHILTPSLSDKSNFSIGTGDIFVTGTAGVTSIILKPIPESINYILGLLNSKLISFYVIKHSPVFQGGYHKFSSNYLKKVPIKRMDFKKTSDKSVHDSIVKLVDKMLSLNKRLNELGDKKTDERARIEEDIKKTDAEIDELVYKIYGITEEEKKIIEESLK